MVDFFLQGLILGISAGISPGPLLALFLAQSARNGWRRTLPAAFAPLISDGPIILLVLLVLSRVPGFYLDILRIAGGLYLLYLAWETLNSVQSTGEIRKSSNDRLTTLKSAVIVNLLSPSPYIFWGTILGPTLIIGWRETPVAGLAFVIGFYLAIIGIFVAWIVIADRMGALGQRTKKAFLLLSSLGLAGFGLFQIAAGIVNLT